MEIQNERGLFQHRSAQEIEELMLQDLESLFDKPYLIPVQVNDISRIGSQGSQQSQNQSQTTQVTAPKFEISHEKDFTNTFLITNPAAIFKVFQKDQFLALPENSQCIILDRLDDILQKCLHNSLILTDHLVLTNVSRLNQQYIAQIVKNYKDKHSKNLSDDVKMSLSEQNLKEKQDPSLKGDFLLLCISLCLKLSTKNQASALKLTELIKKLTYGKRYMRCHIEFIYQYLKMRCAKLCKQQKSQLAHQKLNTALKLLNSIYESRYEVGPQNYFYFSGYLSGIQVNTKQIQSTEFQRGFTACVWFQIHENQLQDDRNLPILFNVFYEGSGGFECYFNGRLLYYRILGKKYTTPTVESNGILLGEFQPRKWYFLATEHERPSFTRSQFSAIINDKQIKSNLSIDYPKIEKNSRLSMMTVCKNFVGQMSSFMIFKEPLNNLKKLINVKIQLHQRLQIYTNYEFGFYNSQQMQIQQQKGQNPLGTYLNTEIIDQKLTEKIFILYNPERSNNKSIYDCVEMRDAELMINSGVCQNGQKAKLSLTGGLISFLPIMDIIKAISVCSNHYQVTNLDQTLNEFLRVINSVMQQKSFSQFEQDQPTPFFNILFHLLNKLPPYSVNNATIQLLAEIRFQIGDTKLQEQFFKNLMYSSDFWINTQNFEVLNEFWLFVKAIYAQNPLLYNKLFSIQNLIDLMVKISEMKDAGYCCEYHKSTFQMFYEGQIGNHSHEQSYPLTGGKQMKERSNSSTLLSQKLNQVSHFKEKNVIHNINKYLAPIAGVLEGVLTSGGNEVLEHIQSIAKSLTVKSSPCFHLQMLKLLKVLLLDSREAESHHCASPSEFAAQFLKVNGLQILLYLCSNSSFDVKAMCVKLIDVLSSHTQLIKMAIDPDVITYMCNIILPRQMMEMTTLREKSQIFKNLKSEQTRMLPGLQSEEVKISEYQMIDEEDQNDNLFSKGIEDQSLPQSNYSPQKFGDGLFLDDDESNTQDHYQQAFELSNKAQEPFKLQQKLTQEQMDAQLEYERQNPDLIPGTRPPPPAPRSGKKPSLQFGFTDEKSDGESEEDQDQDKVVKNKNQKFNQTMKPHLLGKKAAQTIDEVNEDEEQRSEEDNDFKDDIQKRFGILGFKEKSKGDDKKGFLNTQKLPIKKGFGGNFKNLALDSLPNEDDVFDSRKTRGHRNTFTGAESHGQKGAIKFTEIDEQSQQNELKVRKGSNTSFANENVMSKSNLRQPKQFMFGFPDDGSESDQDNQVKNASQIEEEKSQFREDVQMLDEPEVQQEDDSAFFEPQRQIRNDDDEEVLSLMRGQKKKNSSVLIPSQQKKGRPVLSSLEDQNQQEGEDQQSINFKKKNLMIGGNTGATSDTEEQALKEQEDIEMIEESKASRQPKKKAVISFQKNAKLFTNTNNKLNLDTDAINELFTYGGEHGQAKISEDEEMRNFEAEIEELASLCIAAMSRKDPSDPVKHPSRMNKQTFESKYLNQDEEEFAFEDPQQNQEKNKPVKEKQKIKNPRQQFMTPQSVRGIKKIEFSMSQDEKNALLEGSRDKLNLSGTMGSLGLQTGKGFGLKTATFDQNTITEELSPDSQSHSDSFKNDKIQGLKSYSSQEMQNMNLSSSLNFTEKFQQPNDSEFIVGKSLNSNPKKRSSDAVLYQHNLFKGKQNQASLLEIEDQCDDAFQSDSQNNDDYTIELENLYTSCLEWIISRAPSSLYENIVIDEVDKIGYQPPIQLLMVLVTHSNNIIRQRAFNDLELLTKWDPSNGSQLLMHPQFHPWLLRLLMPYQNLSIKFKNLQGSSLAVYDIGCKLHTLLMRNISTNPEEEAYKKLNFLMRWPQIHKQQTLTSASERIERDYEISNKLTRVLACQLIQGLRDDASRIRPQIARLQPTWQNLIYLIFLSEELIFGSTQKSRQVRNNQVGNRDLNGSLYKWIQRDLYSYLSSETKSTWAEWELVDQILITIDSIYPEWMYSMEKNKTIKVEDLIFSRLEKKGSADELSQIVDVLLHEGSPYKMDQPAQIQAPSAQKQTSSKAKGILRGVLGGGKHQNEQSQSQINDNLSYFQHLNVTSEQSFMKTILNIMCASLVQAENKPQIQLLLERFERFVKFLMIVSETWKSRLVNTLYNNYQRKFTECISFAFAFLFHEIHNTNQVSQRQSNQTNTNLSQGSNTSSPKDQMFNKLYAQSLKNLMIYFVNIVEFQNLKGSQGQNESHLSACRHIFSSVLVKSYEGNPESLIGLKEIMRIKQNDYDDFPEFFYMSDWKVAIFNGERIRQIVSTMINEQQIMSFISKRSTYAIHYNDTQSSTDKAKDEILKRMQQDTIEIIGMLSSEEFERKNKVALLNDNFIREQAYNWRKVKGQLLGNHGMWRMNLSSSDGYLVSCFDKNSEGVKPYLKERFTNGFILQENDPQLEKDIFTELYEEPTLALFEPEQLKFDSQSKNLSKGQGNNANSDDEEDDESDFIARRNLGSQQMISFFSKSLNKIERAQLKKQFLNHLREYLYQSKQKVKEILVDVKCSILKPFYQRPGQVTLTSQEIIFFDDLFTPANLISERDNIFFFKYNKRPDELLYKIISLNEIKEIQKRRFLGRKTALEIFLINNKSVLLNFSNVEDREHFAKKIVRQRGQKSFNLRYYDTLEPKKLLKKKELTDRWAHWKISNFEYLMELNTLAGRSYNDLSQYPVFPWLFVDFSSQTAPDIQGANTISFQSPQGHQIAPNGFRDLNKNMQLLGSAERQAEFKRKSEDLDSFNSPNERFHCGSHYSNPGIVLHYLSRISPYIDALVELHGKHLDSPDRGFHSLQESLNGALSDSSDVRELIPEFFFCPEMFINLNKIKFGKKQDDVVVNDVVLPPWCNHNPHLFVLFMREAFESNYVSQNLGGWIDYIFGVKQRDIEAEKSLNLFAHITYEDSVDIDGITDQLMKQSLKEQIYNYGQTPSQLFPKNKHPQRLPKSQALKFNCVVDNSSKIKVYKPVVQQSNKNPSTGSQATQVLIQPEGILKARFADDQTIIGLSKDGTVTYFFWLAKAHEINPNTPFTCCEDKKRKFDYKQKSHGLEVFDRSIKKFDFPLQILHTQKCILRGGLWGGKLAICPIEGISQDPPSYLNAHTSTVTAINATANDKLVITGSKNGDVIVWNYQPLTQTNQSNDFNWQIRSHLCNHEAMISMIHINEELNLYLTCSFDGTANLHNLYTDKLIRTFQHPRLSPIYSAILTQVPLPACCFFSREDHYWYSFSMNGQFLEKQKEDCSHIISPQVVKDSNFMEKLVYGTEKGYLILRQLPLLKQFKKQQVSPIYPVLSIIVSPERRFLLVGCGDGGLNVVTEPFQISQITSQSSAQMTQSQILSSSIISTSSAYDGITALSGELTQQNSKGSHSSTQNTRFNQGSLSMSQPPLQMKQQPFPQGINHPQELSQILQRQQQNQTQSMQQNYSSYGGSNFDTNVNQHQYRE